MKRHIISAAAALCCHLFACLTLQAQLSVGGTPPGLTPQFQQEFPRSEAPLVKVAAPDKKRLMDEDQKNGTPNRYAVNLPASFSFENSGEWLRLRNGDRVWRLRIEAPGASSLHLLYREFDLPEESFLYVYTPDGRQVLGGFSSFNNPDGGTFASAALPGEAIILEYFEPAEVRGLGKLAISNVCYGYKPLFSESGKADCFIDVNCPAGDDWQNEKRGVVLISIQTTQGAFYCSGSLLNNTLSNTAPYIHSAQHCITGGGEPVFEQFIFYFNAEFTGCNNGETSPNLSTLTGCSLRSMAYNSDFLLLELSQAIPEAPYNPYYNGWTREGTAPASTTGISHPGGGCKKIHFDCNPPEVEQNSITTNQGCTYPANHFWRTTPDEGRVTPGSSGSPLFDPNKRVMGQLSFGGGFECNETNVAWYGMFHQSWNPPGSGADGQLQYWLDPAGTNPLTLNGYEPPASCCASAPVEELDKMALGNLSKFFSKELKNNIVDAQKTYIRHQSEIERMLSSKEARYAGLQSSLERCKAQGKRLFLRAFVFDMDNVLTDKQLEPVRSFLTQMKQLSGSAELKSELDKILRALPLLEGKDLESAVIFYDQWIETDTRAASAASAQEPSIAHFELRNGLGETPVLYFSLPESGEITVRLMDGNGRLQQELLSENREKGSHELPVPKAGLPPGVYYLHSVWRNDVQKKADVQKMVVW